MSDPSPLVNAWLNSYQQIYNSYISLRQDDPEYAALPYANPIAFSTTANTTQVPDAFSLASQTPLNDVGHTLPADSTPILTTPQPNIPIVLSDLERRIFSIISDMVKYFGIEWCAPRVAGGWVRDKALGKLCNDIDITLNGMCGETFATLLKVYCRDKFPDTPDRPIVSSIGVIEGNSEKLKQILTATFFFLGLSLDVTHLRSQTYPNESYILEQRQLTSSDSNKQIDIGAYLDAHPISPTAERHVIPQSIIPIRADMGSMMDDVMRRDFRCNTLLYNILTQSIEDITGFAYHDLCCNTLTTPVTPYKTFKDEAVRVFRALRFVSKSFFRIDSSFIDLWKPQPLYSMQRRMLCERIATQRLGTELDKCGQHPTALLRALYMISIFHFRDIIFPMPFNSRKHADPPIPNIRGKTRQQQLRAEITAKYSHLLSDDVISTLQVDPLIALQIPLFALHDIISPSMFGVQFPTQFADMIKSSRDDVIQLQDHFDLDKQSSISADSISSIASLSSQNTLSLTSELTAPLSSPCHSLHTRPSFVIEFAPYTAHDVSLTPIHPIVREELHETKFASFVEPLHDRITPFYCPQTPSQPYYFDMVDNNAPYNPTTFSNPNLIALFPPKSDHYLTSPTPSESDNTNNHLAIHYRTAPSFPHKLHLATSQQDTLLTSLCFLTTLRIHSLLYDRFSADFNDTHVDQVAQEQHDQEQELLAQQNLCSPSISMTTAMTDQLSPTTPSLPSSFPSNGNGKIDLKKSHKNFLQLSSSPVSLAPLTISIPSSGTNSKSSINYYEFLTQTPVLHDVASKLLFSALPQTISPLQDTLIDRFHLSVLSRAHFPTQQHKEKRQAQLTATYGRLSSGLATNDSAVIEDISSLPGCLPDRVLVAIYHQPEQHEVLFPQLAASCPSSLFLDETQPLAHHTIHPLPCDTPSSQRVVILPISTTLTTEISQLVLVDSAEESSTIVSNSEQSPQTSCCLTPHLLLHALASVCLSSPASQHPLSQLYTFSTCLYPAFEHAQVTIASSQQEFAQLFDDGSFESGAFTPHVTAGISEQVSVRKLLRSVLLAAYLWPFFGFNYIQTKGRQKPLIHWFFMEVLHFSIREFHKVDAMITAALQFIQLAQEFNWIRHQIMDKIQHEYSSPEQQHTTQSIMHSLYRSFPPLAKTETFSNSASSSTESRLESLYLLPISSGFAHRLVALQSNLFRMVENLHKVVQADGDIPIRSLCLLDLTVLLAQSIVDVLRTPLQPISSPQECLEVYLEDKMSITNASVSYSLPTPSWTGYLHSLQQQQQQQQSHQAPYNITPPLSLFAFPGMSHQTLFFPRQTITNTNQTPLFDISRSPLFDSDSTVALLPHNYCLTQSGWNILCRNEPLGTIQACSHDHLLSVNLFLQHITRQFHFLQLYTPFPSHLSYLPTTVAQSYQEQCRQSRVIIFALSKGWLCYKSTLLLPLAGHAFSQSNAVFSLAGMFSWPATVQFSARHDLPAFSPQASSSNTSASPSGQHRPPLVLKGPTIGQVGTFMNQLRGCYSYLPKASLLSISAQVMNFELVPFSHNFQQFILENQALISTRSGKQVKVAE